MHAAISRHYRADCITYLDPTASRIVAESEAIPMLPLRRTLIAYELAKQGDHRFISGHWPVDQAMLKKNAENWSFMTILRDPVDRWLSNYFFNRHRQQDRDHFGTSLDLEAYLETSDAIENGKLYLAFANGGHFPDGDPTKAMADAISVYKQFHLIGILDDLDAFLDEFESRWHIRPQMEQNNASPASRSVRDAALSQSVLQRIEDICAPDRAIYAAIRDHLRT